MTIRVLVLLIPAMLAACTTAIDPGRTQSIRRVAIISAIGDRFSVKKIGVTVFGNEQLDFPIDAWGVDEAVTGKLRGILSRRFEVRPATYQRSAFAAPWSTPGDIADAVRAQMPVSEIDAFIVVNKGVSHYGGTNQNVEGIGIVEGGPLLLRKFNVHALYRITVIDGRQFAVIGNASSWSLDRSALLLQGLQGPNREVDASWWPVTLDAAQNPRLKSAVLDLLDQNIPGTLQNLKIME
jgi:hypothetical protein